MRFKIFSLLAFLSIHVVVASSTTNNNRLSSLSSKDLQIGDSSNSGLGEPMPSLFGEGEDRYDKYAKCLAATEGLRKMRDTKLNSNRREKSSSSKDEKEERIATEYAMHSAKVLESFGMTVKQFNDLGKQVGKSTDLKEKVLEQAYLYRMTFLLDDLNRIPLVEDPESEKMLKSTRKKREKMFCKSMQEIEQLRSDQMDKLKRSLRVQQLPKGITLSDPNVLPFLSPKVRAVVEAFPFQAEQIVKKYGLNSDEFNDMLSQAKGNPFFRNRVDKYMKEERNNDDDDENAENDTNNSNGKNK
mmetsp:Transcript_28329/g.32370  ORF Transcript_28329/g.32370 Transcript_28329/m.32370 type:complete len:300 (-) Transcript_28329:22-921(-)|eukprot:CAMPEP_0194139748 /NCGR_PEP_ID=MMETSP0152-20130528/9354_1 /TAXON_ID=1049557 /ORGANISM="Thalassiothrix antarctica, Strain L6-D1" /LENGTH=299 /DNA_ID=CAMNT_0038837697 /DNA_START=57 /DNA_END=959 /DNA_ORIENTATION=-